MLGLVGLVIFLLIWWLMAEAFAIERDPGTQEELLEEQDAVIQNLGALEDADPLDNRVPEDAPEGTYTGVRIQVPGKDTSQVNIRLDDDAGGIFRVHPKTGEVRLGNAELDYERTTVYTIVASANDQSGGQYSSNFTIQIRDRNEFSIGDLQDSDPAENQVEEDASLNTYTGLTAFAEDGDRTDEVTYRLLDSGRGLFRIDQSSGRLSVQDTSALKRNGLGSVPVIVVASSQDFTADTARFMVQVIPANEQQVEEAISDKVYPILPTPMQVVRSYPSLVQDDSLAKETFKSIWLNMQGYIWAVLLSIPLGFIIGLFPIFRGLFSKQVDALRYLPLTALTGLFIIWFGIEDQMKIAFLAFGILVYLLPVVVQRIDEVQKVYTQTVFTLGATNWQTIRSVYIPSVMSKVIDDIRVLTAISWTYIIIAELVNREGGIGSLIYIKARQGQIAKVFAILLVIILIGFIQDRIFVYMDKRLFPHKYHKSRLNGIRETEYGIFVLLLLALFAIAQSIWFPGLESSMMSLAAIVGVTALIIIGYGEWKLFSSKKQMQ